MRKKTMVVALAVVFALLAHVLAIPDDPDYLWAFEQVGSVAGPHVAIRAPEHAKSWFKYLVNAQSHITAGRLDDAAQSYTTLLDGFRLPVKETFDVHLALGQVLVNMSLLEQAESTYIKASQINASSHLPHFFLGVVHTKQGRFDAAITAYEHALVLDPRFFPSLHNIGSVHFILGNNDQALFYFKAALDRLKDDPNFQWDGEEKEIKVIHVVPRMVNHVLKCFSEVRGGEESVSVIAATLSMYVKHVARLDLSALHLNLAFSLLDVGAFELGMDHMARVLSLEPTKSWITLFQLLSVPVVPKSKQHLATLLFNLKRDVKEAVEDQLTVSKPDAMREMYYSTYQYPYLGFDTKELMVGVSRLWCNSFPVVNYVAPEVSDRYNMHTKPYLRALQVSQSQPVGLIKVGILSYQLFDTPVGHLIRCLVKRMISHMPDRAGVSSNRYCMGAGSTSTPVGFKNARFEVTVVLARPYGDQVTRAVLQDAHHVVRLPDNPRDIVAARDVIASKGFDVLLVADDGVDPFIFTLLHARVAPIQMVYMSGGGSHALSLGSPDTVDYYLTGDITTPDKFQQEMNEQVVRLGDIGMFAPRLPLPSEQERFDMVAKYNLFGSRHFYLVPRLLNAIHVEFDDVLGNILTQDTVGEVMIMYEQQQELWLEQLRTRFKQHPVLGKVWRRVKFAKKLQQRELWTLMLSADVILDTFPVGMGIVALEALSLGVPVVTLPSRQKGRTVAAGALRRLEMEVLIASNSDEFVSTAVQVASSLNLRTQLSAKIKARRQAIEWTTEDRIGAEYMLSKPRNLVTTKDASFLVPKEVMGTALEADTIEYYQRIQEKGLNDPSVTTLNDWLSLIARAGYPWAYERELSMKRYDGRPHRKQ